MPASRTTSSARQLTALVHWSLREMLKHRSRLLSASQCFCRCHRTVSSLGSYTRNKRWVTACYTSAMVGQPPFYLRFTKTLHSDSRINLNGVDVIERAVYGRMCIVTLATSVATFSLSRRPFSKAAPWNLSSTQHDTTPGFTSILSWQRPLFVWIQNFVIGL
ncbi:hypothetical protein BKA70DRAFT_682918 [Coprinopsis sp. MPI-PUGE-AT-0042]|nr:hypothetical protein BKA70DRAFT_682918 [Coprinopsis sp. MPI-PUGE-AT-0042]